MKTYEQTEAAVLAWLIEHRIGDVSEMAKALGIDWREIENCLNVLRTDGVIRQYTYRWDGSPVWSMVE